MLCRPHEDPFTLRHWNLHGKNLVQFPHDTIVTLLGLVLGPRHYRHQIRDQCSRVHVRYLNLLDSYHGTRENRFQLSAVSYQFSSFRPTDLRPLRLSI